MVQFFFLKTALQIRPNKQRRLTSPSLPLPSPPHSSPSPPPFPNFKPPPKLQTRQIPHVLKITDTHTLSSPSPFHPPHTSEWQCGYDSMLQNILMGPIQSVVVIVAFNLFVVSPSCRQFLCSCRNTSPRWCSRYSVSSLFSLPTLSHACSTNTTRTRKTESH